MDETNRVGGEALPDEEGLLNTALFLELKGSPGGDYHRVAALLRRLAGEQASDPTPALDVAAVMFEVYEYGQRGIGLANATTRHYNQQLEAMRRQAHKISGMVAALASPQAGASDPTPPSQWEALYRIRQKLIRMGAKVPIEVDGTIKSAMSSGHSHALLLVEDELALAALPPTLHAMHWHDEINAALARINLRLGTEHDDLEQAIDEACGRARRAEAALASPQAGASDPTPESVTLPEPPDMMHFFEPDFEGGSALDAAMANWARSLNQKTQKVLDDVVQDLMRRYGKLVWDEACNAVAPPQAARAPLSPSEQFEPFFDAQGRSCIDELLENVDAAGSASGPSITGPSNTAGADAPPGQEAPLTSDDRKELPFTIRNAVEAGPGVMLVVGDYLARICHAALAASPRPPVSDSARLDWIQENRTSIYRATHTEIRPTTAPWMNHEKVEVFDGWCIGMADEPKPTVREAIDEAMLAATPALGARDK